MPTRKQLAPIALLISMLSVYIHYTYRHTLKAEPLWSVDMVQR